ncbi:MAG: STAS/SEC14 domain-containing protein [Chloroflexota bacterium]
MAHEMQLISDKILKVSLIGDFNEDGLAAYNIEYEQYLANVSGENPLHVLADAAREGRLSAAARRDFSRRTKEDDRVGRTAIINAKRVNRVMATFIMKAAGRSEQFRFFDNEQDAVAWLNTEYTVR